MIRVILGHHYALDRQGLAALLRSQPDVELVAEAEDGEGALALIQQHAPDLALLDIGMVGRTGVEVAREAAASGLRTKVLILCTQEQALAIGEVAGDGVWAIICKCRGFDEMVASLRAAFASPAPEFRPHGHEHQLSPRERDTLRLLCEGLHNKEIAERLAVGTRTVDAYRLSIMRKLGIPHLPGLVKYALRYHLTSLDH